MKQIIPPCLELCEAHLLMQRLDLIIARMLLHLYLPIAAFCDSTVSPAWIRRESHHGKIFVGNCVAAIQELFV